MEVLRNGLVQPKPRRIRDETLAYCLACQCSSEYYFVYEINCPICDFSFFSLKQIKFFLCILGRIKW